MPSDGRINATHAPGRRGELDSMHVDYNEPLAAWIFPRQVTHGSYAVHRVDGCTRARFVYFSKKNRRRWKNKVTATKEQRTAQARCTTTSIERRAHRTAYVTAARNPAAAYTSAPSVGCGLLTALWLARRK